MTTLTVSLPSATEILLSRDFDAPRALVFKAFTDPALIPRWWGPRAYTTRVDKMDLRPGGVWRYVHGSPGGAEDEHGFHGEYLEIVPDERIVSTEVYEGFPDAQATNTMTLVEEAGRTTLTTLVQHTSKEHRDGHVNSGMEGGMQESFDALERVAVSLK